MGISSTVYALIFIIIFTSILRVIELFIAKKNMKSRSIEVGLKIPEEKGFFLFIFLHVTFLIAVPFEVVYFSREFIDILGIPMFILYVLCLLLRLHILKIMGISWNTKVVHNPENYNSIITTGIYKFIRHPNYLVVVLEITSISLFHTALFSFGIFSLFNFILLYFRIRFEEEELFKNMKYREHFFNKKRFIPGII